MLKCLKLGEILGLICWIGSSFKNLNTFFLLYNALVWSHHEYASAVWNRKHDYMSATIEGVQHRFVSLMSLRFSYIHAFRDYASSFENLCLPPLEKIRTANNLLFFFINFCMLFEIMTLIIVFVSLIKLRGRQHYFVWFYTY